MRMAGWQTLLKIVIMLVGIAGIVAFILPLVRYGILNIGNATGLAAFVCIFLYGLGMRTCNRLLARGWQHMAGKIGIGAAGLILIAAVILCVVMSALMVRACAKKPTENAVLVVLGCKVNGENASLMLNERINAAYAYLEAHENTVCVLSGGQGSGESISEAECMYRALVKKGVAPERLYKEEKSTSTRENLRFSMQVIEDNGLLQEDVGRQSAQPEQKDDTAGQEAQTEQEDAAGGQGAQTQKDEMGKANRQYGEIAIVTNEFHEYRAQTIAEGLGIEAAAVPAATAWWLFPTFYARELFGILYQWVL